MIKMVIVDDYIETAESLSILYKLKGDVHIVGLAQNSEQLWGMLRHNKVDLVSLDIQLEHENGLEICKLLHDQYPDIFIVMCSVEATEENKKIATEAGASHFLAKPMGIKDVAETLQRCSKRTVNADKSPLTETKLAELFDRLR